MSCVSDVFSQMSDVMAEMLDVLAYSNIGIQIAQTFGTSMINQLCNPI